MRNNYYVYTATVDGILRYIGKGKGNRIDHCTSGKSTCALLNRDWWEGYHFIVEKVAENLTDQEAVELERKLINENKHKLELYNQEVVALMKRHLKKGGSIDSWLPREFQKIA